ncbi:MAG: glycosyltransferase family 2 protein [Candidatus Hodarchaeota archaeon]
MKLSIIMAVYNSDKSVSQAIQSILNQTYSDFEFIIVDDGSTDHTNEIIKDFSNKDKRIKFLRNSTNIGLTRSLNNAIRQSKGEYIGRQDGDDISFPERFQKQIDFLEINNDYAFCGCNGIIKQTSENLLKFFDINEIRKNLILENCFFHPSIVVRKNIFKLYGLYNEKFLYGQDYELWCRFIYKYNLKAKNLTEKLIIASIPSVSLLEKKRNKILIQMKNDIITKWKYFKYSNNKLKGIKSIVILIIKIIIITLFSSNK